jgi:3-oxoadipate enol-lactonase
MAGQAGERDVPTIRIRGVDLYYEEQGSGPSLVIAHGLMGSVGLAARLGGPSPARLAEHGLHVVAYDARGHGRSGFTRGRGDYSWPSHARDLAELIRALGLERPSLCGTSMGAGSALLLAVEEPRLVDRLVLLAPPPFGRDLATARRLFVSLSVLYQLLGTALTARLVSALPGIRDIEERVPGSDVRAFLAAQRRGAVIPAIRGLLLSRESLPTERFGEIRGPALVLAHRGDPIHPVSSAEVLRARLSEVQVAVGPHSSFWQERPDLQLRLVAAFVRGESLADLVPAEARLSDRA